MPMPKAAGRASGGEMRFSLRRRKSDCRHHHDGFSQAELFQGTFRRWGATAMAHDLTNFGFEPLDGTPL